MTLTSNLRYKFLLFAFSLTSVQGVNPDDMQKFLGGLSKSSDEGDLIKRLEALLTEDKIENKTEIDKIIKTLQEILVEKKTKQTEENQNLKADTKYKQQSTSWWHMIASLIIKASVGAIFNQLVAELMDGVKLSVKPQYAIYDLYGDSVRILQQTNTKNVLYLTEEQQNLMDYFSVSFFEFLAKNKKPTVPGLMGLAGTPGTGKSAFMYILAAKILTWEQKYRPKSTMRSFTTSLPSFLKKFFTIRETENGIYIVMSGAYFYNYSNETEKAAGFLDKMLQKLLNHIRKNKKNFFIFILEEGELLFQEPFARVMKIFSSDLTLINQENKKYGYGLVMVSTNFPEMIEASFGRRMALLNFNTPTGQVKLKTLLLYLEKHLTKKEYTPALLGHINQWVKFCEFFSHSDMENIAWSAKLQNITTHVIITCLDVLKIIYTEWKKRKLIVEKQKENDIRLVDLENLILSMEKYTIKFYNHLDVDPSFEQEFKNLDLCGNIASTVDKPS